MKPTKFILLCLLILSTSQAFSTTADDSLRIEKIKGEHFILHRVEPKETLFSLLKKYGVTNEQFQNANPSLAGSAAINIDQIVLFPTLTVLPATKEQSGPVQEIAKPQRLTLVHQVKPNETLYSICKQYNVGIDEVKELNGLAANEISLGQSLKIKKSLNDYAQITEAGALIDKSPVKNAIPESLPAEKVSVPEIPKGKMVTETGIAELISSKRNSTKMLALHKYAPMGSMITVKNSATGNQVVVKVIGKLPQTGNNQNVVVKLSPSAFYKLGPKDVKIPAKVTYFKEPNS